MEERKLNLINALKDERSRFEKNGHDTTEHDVAINYLETGETDESPENFDLLDAIMNDYLTTCSDYSV